MLKVTKETDYALLLLVELAQAMRTCKSPLSAVALAEKASLPQTMVGKTLKALSQANLLESIRGPQGGYRLAHAPSKITILDIVEALEGPVALAECVSPLTNCCSSRRATELCRVSKYWHSMSQLVARALSETTLEQLAGESFSSSMAAFPSLPELSLTVSVTQTRTKIKP